MKINFFYIAFILLFFFTSFNVNSIVVPKSGVAEFDIVRKNKIIGSHKIKFTQDEDSLNIETKIDIEVKVLFIPAYKFTHNSLEIWIDGSFTKIDAYTDFEDEREYFIDGNDENGFFLASGMDGDLKLDENILPSNFWNINVLNEKKLFDTQKGIVREIKTEFLGDEEIKINKNTYNCQKFSLNASSNPKDKGPFPEYTLWYNKKNNELMKFSFKNWKDKKIVTILRKK